MNEDGTPGAPAFVSLGHELAHARDMQHGKDDKETHNGLIDPDSGEKNVLSNSEIKTRKTENGIRDENKIIKRKLPYK